ncbi:LemA family protein [Candidatus Woesebacteria bacterium]|nr:LemA family protein [Candidatus Woesebacteria bacterium]
MLIYILIGIAVVVLLWVVMTYNFFVSAKARISAAKQEIGNQLKRQFDLIPNLEESTKGYLKHEKGIFQDLTAARKSVAAAVKSGDLAEMAEAGSRLAGILPKIQVLVEDNPELKANEVVARLMDELRDTSDKVMYSRRLLIDLVADYNVKRVSFPSNLIANMFNFEAMVGLKVAEEGEHLEVSEVETKAPKVKLS